MEKELEQDIKNLLEKQICGENLETMFKKHSQEGKMKGETMQKIFDEIRTSEKLNTIFVRKI